MSGHWGNTGRRTDCRLRALLRAVANNFRKDPVAYSLLGLCGVTILATMVMMVVSLLPRSVRLSVADMTWTCSVDVYETMPVRHEGWELPEGSTLLSAEKRPYQYVRRRNEFMGRPIYADWYAYEMTESVVVSSPTRSGRKGEEIVAPDVALSDGQRLGGERQELVVEATDGKRYAVCPEVWDALSVGDEVEATVSPDGKITDVKDAT